MAVAMSDFSYRVDGLFTVLYANTERSSAELSRFIRLNGGSNKVLTMHFSACRKALRAAGWTIGKQLPMTEKRKAWEMEKMLKELDSFDGFQELKAAQKVTL
jgi:hypothetical protein